MPNPKPPRARQRIVYCDCRDCRDLPLDLQSPGQLSGGALNAASVAARQIPYPPKALILLASGFLCSEGDTNSLDSTSHPHLDRVVHEGCLGLLAVRSSTTAEPESTAGLTELAQLMGCHDEYLKQRQADGTMHDEEHLPQLQERFKGMKAACTTNTAAATGLALSAGWRRAQLAINLCYLPNSQEPYQRPCSDLPDTELFARHLLFELGVDRGRTGPDIALVHLDRYVPPRQQKSQSEASSSASAPSTSQQEPQGDAVAQGLRWLDDLVGQMLENQHVRERVLLTVVVSAKGRPVPGGAGPGATGPTNRHPPRQVQSQPLQQYPAQLLQIGGMQKGGASLDPTARVVNPPSVSLGTGMPEQIHMALDVLESCRLGGARSPVTRPIQSFQLCGMQHVDVAQDAPAVVARRLPGVIRRDRAEHMSLQEAHQRGGQGTMLMDRLLHEIAYKLGRAPKYGA